ncbi:uncharacterized protein LOC132724239 [Ruditapes philippinarum]|uniref:uncharacterized protein LOC132724239 n=1 Tax=Ruditapes philippinarum TaxID=129788 RepID=UPI00295AF281|nr:uncharacterized protein LOC132724239 [Ruditapes philippinarum]
MKLVAIFIFFLELSFSLCRIINSQYDKVHPEQNLKGDAHMFGLFGKNSASEIFETISDNNIATKMIESNQQFPISKEENDIVANREKRSVHVVGSEDNFAVDTEMNNEITSYLQTENEVEQSMERHMTSFYVDMINLFQYELLEIADRESKTRQHLRQQRKSPSLRPKRSLRSLLKDAHIKNILMKYFQQKQSQEHGNPLLRYG